MEKVTKNVLIINAHQPYSFSQGKLNGSLADKAAVFFMEHGYQLRRTTVAGDYDVNEEMEKLKWADVVFLQTPINWMGVPWSFKKYIDEVWTAGLKGELSNGDGRSPDAPKKNYGTGGKLSGHYMLSITANAPKEAFNDRGEKFFDGISEDDLMLATHLNFKWLGMGRLPTFVAYDVMKNPDIDGDFLRFESHLAQNFL